MRAVVFSALSLTLAALVATGCPRDSAPQQSDPEGEAPVDEPAAERESRGLVAEGSPIPDFSSEAHDGTLVSPSAMLGSPWVLYFYPKDDTPGCTAEARGFRDAHADLEALDARVFGASLDDLESHRSFAEAHDLTFPLIADTDGAIAESFGVSTEAGYAERVTFVIDAEGTIAKVFPEVEIEGHADEVLDALRAL